MSAQRQPAVSPNNNGFAANDCYGTPRPVGVKPDRGAFETSVPAGIKAAQAAKSGSAS